MKRLQSPFKRTVVLDGHKTSINVEPEFWDQLRLITLERQTTMAKLITEIDRIGRLLPLLAQLPPAAFNPLQNLAALSADAKGPTRSARHVLSRRRQQLPGNVNFSG